MKKIILVLMIFLNHLIAGEFPLNIVNQVNENDKKEFFTSMEEVKEELTLDMNKYLNDKYKIEDINAAFEKNCSRNITSLLPEKNMFFTTKKSFEIYGNSFPSYYDCANIKFNGFSKISINKGFNSNNMEIEIETNDYNLDFYPSKKETILLFRAFIDNVLMDLNGPKNDRFYDFVTMYNVYSANLNNITINSFFKDIFKDARYDLDKARLLDILLKKEKDTYAKNVNKLKIEEFKKKTKNIELIEEYSKILPNEYDNEYESKNKILSNNIN